ncbi:MAG: ABC transporter substrate-binding protein [Desulfarculaceae bacterium]|jgi:peptide/nickel transport system substrate-binding protein
MSKSRRVFWCLALALGLMLAGPALVQAAKPLVHGAASEPRSLDPYFHSETPTNSMNSNIYDGLVNFDSELNVIPALAEKWENPDNLTWIFHLRKGVKFHDGSPLTAEDVAFSIKRCQTWAKSGFKSTVNQIKSVEILGPHKIKLTTPKPFGILHRKLAQLNIMCKKYVEKMGDDAQADKPNGTGAYKVKEWIKGDHLTLVANENYFRGVAKIKEIVLRPLTNDATRTAALLSGEVDVIDDMPVLDVARIKADPKVEVISRPGLRLIYLQMDQDREKSPKAKGPDGKNPLLKLKVRKALYYGINEDAIIKHVMNGVAFPAGQFYPSAVFGYDKTIKRPAYNPKKAKQLLKEAGYPNGFEITISSPNDRYVNDDKIAQAVASSLAKLGIKIKVQALPKKTFFPMTDRREASFFLIGWSCATGDASAFLDGIAHTYNKEKGYGRYNRGRYSNPKVDKLIEAASATVNQKGRLKYMQEAQRIALVKDQAFIPLHFQVDLYAKSKKLNWKPRADHYFWYYDMSMK